MQITQAAKDLNLNNVRLVAIAKDRLGWEEFTHDYWPPPAEIYFDTAEPGYPFFKATNGKNQGVVKMLTSYMFGGEAANNLKLGNVFKGEGSVLGSVMVVSSTGQVLLHHKEKVVGDHPDDEELRVAMMAAVAQLGRTGVVSCECEDDKKND